VSRNEAKALFDEVSSKRRGLEDDILSAFLLQLPRCIVCLLYFRCIANRLICCSSCD